MKKNCLLFLGILLVAGGAFISLSDASRDVYHAMMYQRSKVQSTQPSRTVTRPYRPFSERTGSWRMIQTTRRSSNDPGQNTSRNLRYPTRGKRYYYTSDCGDNCAATTVSRPSTDRITPLRYTSKRGVLRVQAFDPNLRYVGFVNDSFKMDVPAGWDREGNYTFRPSYVDVTLDVRYLESECGNHVGFDACAMAISKDRNHVNPAEKLVPTTRVEKTSGYAHVMLGEPTVQNATFMEAFQGVDRGEESFIARYYVSDGAEGVYVLEVKGPAAFAGELLGMSKHVFDSFHIQP